MISPGAPLSGTLSLPSTADPSRPAPPAWTEGVGACPGFVRLRLLLLEPHLLPPILPVPGDLLEGQPSLTGLGLLGTGGWQRGQSRKDGSGASGRWDVERGARTRCLLPGHSSCPREYSRVEGWQAQGQGQGSLCFAVKEKHCCQT